MKLRINAKDKSASNTRDNCIAHTYRNKFIITLYFEMLDSSIPYYQWRLSNRLCYEITFNDYGRVIKSMLTPPAKTDAKYEISDIYS